jgi:hypothetical protein
MVMVGEWKAKDGQRSFTVCGTKEEIYQVLEAVRESGGKFADTPVVNYVHRGQWHTLLKLKVPVEVGAGDKNS